mmetsp:Transcript_79147/g.212358  ORF Transcript_79147/g.212358 Transcript_79147/m.212358 type:complete len:94 (-) Transcript_79147:179-460(-)
MGLVRNTLLLLNSQTASRNRLKFYFLRAPSSTSHSRNKMHSCVQPLLISRECSSHKAFAGSRGVVTRIESMGEFETSWKCCILLFRNALLKWS